MQENSNNADLINVIKSFIRWLRGMLPLIAFAIVIVLPLPYYLTIVPDYILLPLLLVVPIFIGIALERRTRTKSSALGWLYLALMWAALVIIIYARALDRMPGRQGGWWWVIGYGLVALLIGPPVVYCLLGHCKEGNSTDASA